MRTFTVLIMLFCATGAMAEQPCKAYFTVVEMDEQTVNVPMMGFNKRQAGWFKKHAKDFPGICYVDVNNGKGQVTLELAIADGRLDRMQDPNPNVPVYEITWGEAVTMRPYHGSYTTQEQTNGTITDENGNTAATTSTTPVEHTYSGVNRRFVAVGTLAKWDTKSQKLVTVAPLKNTGFFTGKYTSASNNLLKVGLEAIEKQ